MYLGTVCSVKFVEGLVGLVYSCSFLCSLQFLVLDRWLNMLSSHVIYDVLIRCTNIVSVVTVCGPNVLPDVYNVYNILTVSSLCPVRLITCSY
jgi:hypothetical protein